MMFCMRRILFQTHLIIEREGNAGVNGLAANPVGRPPGKRHLDTTLCGRCKGFSREGEEVSVVDAFAVSPVREREVMGARICGAIF